MANQFKFVGIDNSTTGGALTPFGTGNPLVSETYVIKSILVTSEGTPTVTVTNNSITAIKSAALKLGTVYSVVKSVVVKSTFLFIKLFAINLKRSFVLLPHPLILLET